MHARNRLEQLDPPCCTALMGLAGRTQRLSTEDRSGLFGSDHDFSVADDLCGRAELRLQLVGQLFDRKGYASG
ncbi:hypothetical protein D3C86_1548080 [compost metagenome]